MRIFVLMIGLLISLTTKSQCSQGWISSVTLTDEQGESRELDCRDKGFQLDSHTYKIELGRIDQRRADVVFAYTKDGHEVSERLNGAFDEIESPLSFHDPYDQETPLGDYIKMMNDKKLPHQRVFRWNADNSVVLNNQRSPLVVFEQSYQLHFWNPRCKLNRDKHTSSLVLSYGPTEDQIVGTYQVHECEHLFEKGALKDTFYLDRCGKLISVQSVVYSDSPWFKKNGVKTEAPYACPELASTGLMVLEAPESAFGKYYHLQPERKTMESRYIYANGEGRCFLTKLEQVNLVEMNYEDRGKYGVQFSKVTEQPPVQITILDILNAPIIMPEDLQITPPFQRGFYEQTRVFTGDSGERREIYLEFPHLQRHQVTHKNLPTLQGFEGTELLLNATDQNKVYEAFLCIAKFEAGFYQNPTFKVVVRLQDKAPEQKVRVGNLLLRLFRFVPRLEADVQGLDVCLTYDQKIFGDYMHQLCLTRAARLPDAKIALDDVQIQNWNTFGENTPYYNDLMRTKPKNLTVKLENDSELGSLAKFIKGNKLLTHLYLKGCVKNLDVPFLGMLADHKTLQHLEIEGFMEKGHLADLKRMNEWGDQQDALAAKWYGLKVLDFEGGKYPFQFFCTGMKLLQLNAENITTLNLNGHKGFKQYGADLVTAVGKMQNLVRIGLMGDVLGNIDTVDMTRVLSTKKLLKEVEIDMPYWVSNALWLPAQAGREFASSRSFTEGCGNAFLLLCSIPLGSLLILGDIDGNPTPHYFQACRNLAVIPQLSLLKLVLWGAFPYGEWTINCIKEDRKQAGLPDTRIEIVK